MSEVERVRLVLERILQGEVVFVSASGFEVDSVGWSGCVVRRPPGIYGWAWCLCDDWLEVVWVGAYTLSLSVWGGRVKE